MCFIRGCILGSCTSSIAPPLSSNAVQCTRGGVKFASIPRLMTSFISFMISIWSCNAEDSATYSASMVDSAIRVWSLDDQVIGHPAYVIVHLDHDFVVMGSFAAPGSYQLPTKSASTQHSKLVVWSGLTTMPLSLVPIR